MKCSTATVTFTRRFPKIVVLVALAVAFAPTAWASKASRPYCSLYHEGVCRLPLAGLVAGPGEWEGMQVSVVGYLGVLGGHARLHLTEDTFLTGDSSSSLPLFPAADGDTSIRRGNGMFVRIVGRVVTAPKHSPDATHAIEVLEVRHILDPASRDNARRVLRSESGLQAPQP